MYGYSKGTSLKILIIYGKDPNFKHLRSNWNSVSSTTLKWYGVKDRKTRPCRVGSVGSVSASQTVGREFASRPGHTKDHHKNGTNCLPA